MRDSVSFCKQILIEYVLKNPETGARPLYRIVSWSVRRGVGRHMILEIAVGLIVARMEMAHK